MPSRAIVRLMPKAKLSSLPLEPSRQRRRNCHDQRFRAHPKNEPPGCHQPKMSRCHGDCGPDKTKNPKDHERSSQSDPVNQNPTNDHGEYIGEAINRLEQADVRIRKTQLLLQHVRQRTQRVIHVIIAEHRDAHKNEHHPAVEPGRLRAHRLSHQHSFLKPTNKNPRR